MSDFNRAIIEEFRANGGKVGGPFEGAPVLLLSTTGAKSGERRTTPVMYLPDGDRMILFASKGVRPRIPPGITTFWPTRRRRSRSAPRPSMWMPS